MVHWCASVCLSVFKIVIAVTMILIFIFVVLTFEEYRAIAHNLNNPNVISTSTQSFSVLL